VRWSFPLRLIVTTEERNQKMSLRKHGLKVLGLSFLTALSLMALSAGGAQAANFFLILNAAETILSNLHATASGEIDLLGVLLIPELNFEVSCHKFTVKEGLILTDGVAHVQLLFETCLIDEIKNKVTGLLTELPKCKVYETAMDEELNLNAGNILAAALILVIKHEFKVGEKTESKIELLAHPKEAGGRFATLFFNELCPVPLESPISGLLTLEAHLGGHQVKQLLREALPNLTLGSLIFGSGAGRPALLDGAAWVFLTGAHEGLKWGIC